MDLWNGWTTTHVLLLIALVAIAVYFLADLSR